MKIRPCLSFLGMTGSGDLLKFRFSKSSYSLSSKIGQDGQETPVTKKGKTGFVFVFSSLLQEKTFCNNLYLFLYLWDTFCKKKSNLYFNLDVNWCKKKPYLQQFVFVFVRHLLQEKKQFVFQFGCKLVRGVGVGGSCCLARHLVGRKKETNN